MEIRRKADNHNQANCYGWNDGRYREQCCLTENRRPAELKAPAERLDRYKDTRAGSGKLVGIAATFSGPHKAQPI